MNLCILNVVQHTKTFKTKTKNMKDLKFGVDVLLHIQHGMNMTN